MPYPFFGYGALPFSMACIVGLGVCVRGDEPIGYGPVVASNIAITKDTINMAIGRRTPLGIFELIGTVYATTAGYSVYVSAEVYTTFGDGSSAAQTLEQLLARWAAQQQIILEPDRTIYNTPADPDSPVFPVYYRGSTASGVTVTSTNGTALSTFDTASAATSMAVFYRQVVHDQVIISTAASSGYMVLGTIPAESIGFHEGEFALDPSCTTYMPNTVFGKYTTLCVNGFKYPMEKVLSLEAGGLLAFDVTGTTATLLPEVGDMKLSYTTNEDIPHVTSLSGVDIKGTTSTPDPTLIIAGQTSSLAEIINWEWARWSYPNVPSNKILTLELNGTKAFPNCYGDA